MSSLHPSAKSYGKEEEGGAAEAESFSTLWLDSNKENKQREKQKEEDWNRSGSSLALDNGLQYSVQIQLKTWQQNETVHHILNRSPVFLIWLIIPGQGFRYGVIQIIVLGENETTQSEEQKLSNKCLQLR